MLPKIQKDFVAHILNHDEEDILSAIRDDGFSPEARMNIYRNNVFITLSEVLANLYPILFALVGEDFFNAMAKIFIRQNPPRPGFALHEYGATMADFLAQFEPAKGLPYLPDVARLEWAMNKSLYAEDVPALDLASLQKISEEDHGRLCFRLHPGVSLLRSPYPLTKIWEMHQPGSCAHQEINLDEGGVFLQIIRGEDGPEIRHLDEEGFAFLDALAAGKNLEQAAQSALTLALQKGQDFDLTKALTFHLINQSFASFFMA